MALEFDLFEGLDPTDLAELGASELLQMIRQASPRGNIGFVIYQSTAPDVLNNPRYARYIWIDTSDIDPANWPFKKYNTTTSSWEIYNPSIGSVNTDSILDGAVTLAKLYAPGIGEALKIVRVKADGSGFELWTYVLSNNSVSPSNLTRGSAGQIFRTKIDGSDNEYFTLNGAEIISRLDDFTIPIDKFALGGANTIPVANSLNTDWQYRTILGIIADGSLPLAKLEIPGAANALKVVRVNSAGTAYEHIASSAIAYQYAELRDQKANNTAGGVATSGAWQNRDLNTKINDESGIVGLDAGTGIFTLGVGTYDIEVSAPAYFVDTHQIRLLDFVAGTVKLSVNGSELYGSSEFSNNDVAAQTRSVLKGRFSVIDIANNQFQIQHRVQTTRSAQPDGFGQPANFGNIEVYTTVSLRKVS